MRQLSARLLLALTVLGLSGCDQLGIETPAVEAARRQADGKAVGAGCRHALRSVEACYELNKRAEKAAVFAGWREMNDYMRENSIEPMPAPAAAASAPGDAADEPAEPAEKSRKVAKSH